MDPISTIAAAALTLLATIIALYASSQAHDTVYAVHMMIFAAAGSLTLFYIVKNCTFKTAQSDGPSVYHDSVVRYGVIATAFWGVVGFAVGVLIACQLAFPDLNFDLPWTNFGRLRPLHTSAVIFAFGGNALIATSFYIVQRTCRTPLAFKGLAWFVFWGYQLFIVRAGS